MDNYDKHYKALDKQPIQVMQETMTKEQFLGFLMGNIIKYELRAGHKDGEAYEKDMAKKARYQEWYSKVISAKCPLKDVCLVDSD